MINELLAMKGSKRYQTILDMSEDQLIALSAQVDSEIAPLVKQEKKLAWDDSQSGGESHLAILAQLKQLRNLNESITSSLMNIRYA
jgi:hypothetical protein